MSARVLGVIGEAEAYRCAVEHGMRPLCKNYRRSTGEIDLICMDGETVVFIEVKNRRTPKHGLPEEAVTPAKQRKIIKTALWYLKENRLADVKIRFDVIAVESGETRYLRSAFDATDFF